MHILHRRPRPAVLAAAALSFFAAAALGGCKSKKEKHLKQIEAAWAAFEAGPAQSPGISDDIEALEAFLAKFPADHAHGNPRATEAQALLDQAREEKAMREEDDSAITDGMARMHEARTKLAPLVAEFLFGVIREAETQDRYEDVDPLSTIPVELPEKKVRLLTRGRVNLSAWHLARKAEPFLEKVNAIVAKAVYDPKTKKYDPRALEDLLEAAYVSPDTPFLGAKAKEIYPIFRPMVRAQARLYRVVYVARDAMKEHEGLFRKEVDRGAELAEDPESYVPAPDDDVPFWSDAVNYATDRHDRRFFYRKTTLAFDVPARTGLPSGSFDYLDTGFWLRRLEDGTAQVLASFLNRTLRDYDPQYLAMLEELEEGGMSAPLEDDSGEGEEEGDYAPEARAPYMGPFDGDRLISLGWTEDIHPFAASFGPDGTTFSVVHRYQFQRFSTADTKVLAEKAVRGANPKQRHVRAAFSADGRRVAIALADPSAGTKGMGPIHVLSSNGETVQVLDDLRTQEGVMLSPDGSWVAAKVAFGKSAARPVARAADAAAPKTIEGHLAGIHHDPPTLYTTRNGTLSAWNPESGELRGSVEVPKTAFRLAVSPDGRTLVLGHETGAIVYRFDSASGAFSERATVRDVGYPEVYFAWKTGAAVLQTGNGETRRLDLDTGALADAGVQGGPFLAMTPDASLVAMQAPAREILLYRLPAPGQPAAAAAP